MIIRNVLLGLALFGSASFCQAAIDRTQLAQIEGAIGQLLRDQTAGLPGKVSFSLGAIDTRLNLPACPALEAFVPAGARLWGNASVGVRCSGNNPWTIYVPVTVRIMAGIVVAAHALAQGQTIGPGDTVLQEADLGQLPQAVVTEPKQALGRVLALGVPPGQPLRLDLLRAPQVIRQGQTVTLLAQGPGFQVSAEGRAVTNAAEGQIVQVRTASGHTVSGIARLGSIVDVQ